MRSHRLKIGLLSATMMASTAIAAEPQQDDRSYLPPAQMRAAPGAATAGVPAAHLQNSANEPRRRQAKAAHRRREPRVYREARYPRYAGPRFFLGFF